MWGEIRAFGCRFFFADLGAEIGVDGSTKIADSLPGEKCLCRYAMAGDVRPGGSPGVEVQRPGGTRLSPRNLPLFFRCCPAPLHYYGVVLRAHDGGSHDKQSHGMAPILPVKATQMPRERLYAVVWVITPPASQNARDGLFSGSKVARCIIPWYTPINLKIAPCVEMPPGVRFYGTGV